MKTYHRKRDGATIVEFLAAGSLLTVVMTFLIPFVGRISIVNEGVSDREFALREVRNIITQMQAGDEVDELSDSVRERLDSAQLSVEREDVSPEELQKVTVSIAWKDHFGESSHPVTLSYWSEQEVQE